MPLPIDVGNVVVWGGRPKSVCGLSFHLSHHGTESILLKNIRFSKRNMSKKCEGNNVK
jgi:hypothetical protein